MTAMLKEKGFTLIELMIVIAIIGTLAGIAVPTFSKYQEKAKRVRVISELKLVEKEILLYQTDNGFFPETLSDIGLDTLMDPWGRPYQYLRIEQPPGVKDNSVKGKSRKDHFLVPVNTDFDLYSMGADGKSQAPFTASDSRDDLVRANNGQYYGLASAY